MTSNWGKHVNCKFDKRVATRKGKKTVASSIVVLQLGQGKGKTSVVCSIIDLQLGQMVRGKNLSCEFDGSFATRVRKKGENPSCMFDN